MAEYRERTVPTILVDLLKQLTDLLRNEGQLARTEMSEKIFQLGLGLVLIIIGAVLLMPALVILLGAAVAALEQAGIQPQWSALIIGGGVLLIGVILMVAGMGRLKPARLMPNKTIRQIQQDASVVRRQMREEDDYERAA